MSSSINPLKMISKGYVFLSEHDKIRRWILLTLTICCAVLQFPQSSTLTYLLSPQVVAIDCPMQLRFKVASDFIICMKELIFYFSHVEERLRYTLMDPTARLVDSLESRDDRPLVETS